MPKRKKQEGTFFNLKDLKDPSRTVEESRTRQAEKAKVSLLQNIEKVYKLPTLTGKTPRVVATPEKLKQNPDHWVRADTYGFHPIGGYFYQPEKDGPVYGTFINENSPVKGVNYAVFTPEFVFGKHGKTLPFHESNAGHMLPNVINSMYNGLHGVLGKPNYAYTVSEASGAGAGAGIPLADVMQPFTDVREHIHNALDARCFGGQCGVETYSNKTPLTNVTNRYASVPDASNFLGTLNSLILSNSASGSFTAKHSSTKHSDKEYRKAYQKAMNLTSDILGDNEGSIPVQTFTEQWTPPRRKGATGNW